MYRTLICWLKVIVSYDAFIRNNSLFTFLPLYKFAKTLVDLHKNGHSCQLLVLHISLIFRWKNLTLHNMTILDIFYFYIFTFFNSLNAKYVYLWVFTYICVCKFWVAFVKLVILKFPKWYATWRWDLHFKSYRSFVK